MSWYVYTGRYIITNSIVDLILIEAYASRRRMCRYRYSKGLRDPDSRV